MSQFSWGLGSTSSASPHPLAHSHLCALLTLSSPTGILLLHHLLPPKPTHLPFQAWRQHPTLRRKPSRMLCGCALPALLLHRLTRAMEVGGWGGVWGKGVLTGTSGAWGHVDRGEAGRPLEGSVIGTLLGDAVCIWGVLTFLPFPSP